MTTSHIVERRHGDARDREMANHLCNISLQLFPGDAQLPNKRQTRKSAATIWRHWVLLDRPPATRIKVRTDDSTAHFGVEGVDQNAAVAQRPPTSSPWSSGHRPRAMIAAAAATSRTCPPSLSMPSVRAIAGSNLVRSSTAQWKGRDGHHHAKVPDKITSQASYFLVSTDVSRVASIVTRGSVMSDFDRSWITVFDSSVLRTIGSCLSGPLLEITTSSSPRIISFPSLAISTKTLSWLPGITTERHIPLKNSLL
jgi:hypothetical protein